MGSNNELISSIASIIDNAGRSPYLFLGSGFSRRYLGTEDWDGLLRSLCSKISDDEFLFEKYAARITSGERYGKNPAIATAMDSDLSIAILEDDKHKSFRESHAGEIHSGGSILKMLAAEHIASFNNILMEDELEQLRQAGTRKISGVITTNYDNLAEIIFPGFKTFVGQDDLLFQKTFEIGEIYKIHGSIDEPQSMVLLSNDYREMSETKDYLAAKLLTIFVEYPIIFIGYSISDPDIQNILKSIVRCMKPKFRSSLRDRFIFVSRGDDSLSTHSLTFGDAGTIEMTEVNTNDFGNVYQAISKSRCNFSPRVMRELRRNIYSMVESSSPQDRIVVQGGFDDLDELEEGTSFIIGIGTASQMSTFHGHMIKAEILYQDTVFDDKHLVPKLVVEEYLPVLLKSNSGGLPMYKYLSAYDGCNIDRRILEGIEERCSLDSFLNGALRDRKFRYRIDHGNTLSIDSIIEEEGRDEAYKRMVFLNEDEIDAIELRSYLKELLKDNNRIIYGNTELKRLIRMYDFIKYKKGSRQIVQ